MEDPAPEARDFKYIAALIGLITTGLYVAGYLAERSHWSLLGIADLPIEHIEFLYRGGNFVVSAVVGTVVFVWDAHKKIASALLVYSVCFALVFTWMTGRLTAKTRIFSTVREILLLLALVLLLTAVLFICRGWPSLETNALFVASNRMESPNNIRFFFAYSALTIGMWLAYVTIRNNVAGSGSPLSARLVLGSPLMYKISLGTAIISSICLTVLSVKSSLKRVFYVD